MPKIFLYGVPGTGKTYVARKLGKQYNIPVIEGDRLKRLARKNVSKSQNPFLYLGTCQAWQELGELNNENAIKGLLAVRQAYADFIKAYLSDKDNFIFEAAFLDPKLVGNENCVLPKPSQGMAKGDFRSLLITQNESQHHRQFYHHREKIFDFKGNEFKAARLIQGYLIAEAKILNIPTIDNSGNDNVVNEILFNISTLKSPK